MRGYATLEGDAFTLAPFRHHGFAPAIKATARPALRAGLCLQIKARLANNR
jgi:hypothetical protein